MRHNINVLKFKNGWLKTILSFGRKKLMDAEKLKPKKNSSKFIKAKVKMLSDF